MTAQHTPSVTQADRDAAGSVWAWVGVLSSDQGYDILRGAWDQSEIVQAFARHREQAEAKSAKLMAELVGALVVCDATFARIGDEPESIARESIAAALAKAREVTP